MPAMDAQLGINFDSNKLFYAVSRPAKTGVVEHIGCIDFSFDLIHSVSTRDPETFPGVCDTLHNLMKDHNTARSFAVSPPSFELWSIIPKTVFDENQEREAHLNILMQGMDSGQADLQWHSLSNRDFKLLSARRKDDILTFTSLLGNAGQDHLFSDFQIGQQWLRHSQFRGSFLSVSSYKGRLSISSYLLGKLRAATFFSYDDIRDLPYHWLQHASHLSWIQGLHEYVMVFGEHSGEIVETLSTYWDDSSDILVMDSLKKMQVTSEEETFSFPLERAFPAVLLSVS
ncbi:hypothetical protein QA596_05090 [Balneolales bacterium ANBcel1]|nr:hypothetical protein [Balneolales bacterium ANBcel1]